MPTKLSQPLRLAQHFLRWGWEYCKFGIDFAVLRQNRPFILGLVPNDTCNLHCIHCRVANVRKSRMSYAEVKAHLAEYYKKGVRFLYLEGGETYLWRDGKYRLQDLIDLAKAIGYLRVHVYTNGTFPLTAQPDFTWVSIDGLTASYQKIRGAPLENVLAHLRNFKQRFAIVCVVNTINYQEIRTFLQFVYQELPHTKVMFFFHTPYYGVDELLLSVEQKSQAIAQILQCKADGLPVLNSKAGLQAILTGHYLHPTNLWWVVDQTGEYQCCRAIGQPEVCRNCGYASCAEVALVQSLNLDAIKTMLWGF